MSDRNHDGWRLVGIGSEGLEVSIGGINPWAYEWQSTGETIEVPHPSYPLQRHMLEVWRTETSVPTRFAAGELSNGVWCFYEPTTDT